MGNRLLAVLNVVVLAVLAGSGCGVVAPSATVPQPPVTPTAPLSSASPTSAPPTVQPTTGPTPPPSTARPGSTATASRTGTAPTTAGPGCDLPRKLLGQDLTTMPGSARVVALTFDAGGSDAGVPSILKTLGERGAPATFFLTGRFTRAFPVASRTIAKNHPVGNHTENHRDLTKLPTPTVRTEIRAGEASIRTATGVNPRPYFRFPLGAR
ncbi:MAG: polysaccharide deacetylase family protein, partial [Propionibacteriaceae bacterium]|nr:polysaccharide deacetylase family protein [Propionibacteriaceae bacterium]